jgi:hypothetical protein
MDRTLGEITGMDFGYEPAEDAASLRAAQERAEKWYNERKAMGRNGWMRQAIDKTIDDLATDDPVQRQVYADALCQVTGQAYRLSIDATPDEVREAIGKWKGWWKENRPKTHIEWLMESIDVEARPLEENMRVFAEVMRYYTAEAFGASPAAAPDVKLEALERLLVWWKENKLRILDELKEGG